ncbi:unnamed protein product [Lactuca saligna]|uniref:Zinc finger GRF-type domain-containing protein n=1 Tax=Lactuca saligna TaxID=75948 RepID=A0AA35Z165_LACSI|nr:unnamed protein product [Lactuca saligna]
MLLLLLLLFLPNKMLNFNLKILVTVGYHLVYELHELKTNQEKNFRLCPNSMNEGPKCKFWEWLEPKTPENEVNSGKDKKELCSLTLKVSILENEISICKMKMEQENLVVRQEFEKLKWKLFTHKVVMIVLFLLFVFKN